MFSLLGRTHNSSPDLLNSMLFSEQTFYESFLGDLKCCQNEVVIESPYMTVPRVNKLLPVLRKLTKRGVRVRVNTRFPEHHDRVLKQQAYSATKLLKGVGVRVFYYYDYHHRKLALLDGRITYEGSLNILSQYRSREIMRRIESEALTKQMKQFLGRKNLTC